MSSGSGTFGSGAYGAGAYGVGAFGGSPGTGQGWTFMVCDGTGRAVGEPVAYGRQWTIGVSQTATASFSVKTNSDVWTAIAAGDATLKVYDSTSALVFFGDVISDELTASGSGGEVQVQAADVSYRLARRYAGKDVTDVGTVYTSQPTGAIVSAVLAAVNAEQPTGIVIGTVGSFVTMTTTVLWTRVLDLVAQLGAIEGSYEWTLRYVDGAPPAVYLDLLAVTGSDRTSSVFLEYGIGLNNCGAYRRVRTLDQLATRVYARGSTSAGVATAYDPAAETSRRFEDVVSYSDIADTALLDLLASAHVAIRHTPRTVVNVTPFPALAPRYGSDWFLGDEVTVRAVVDNVIDTSGVARIWGASIGISDTGDEQATLVLEPQS